MSILELPTEILELVIRDLDPLSLVSLYQSHSTVADRIDTTTGIWERVCRRYTPADPLKAVIKQHFNHKFCFTPDKWQLICLKLAKPFLYVSHMIKHKRRLWRHRGKRNDRYNCLSNFFVDGIFTFGDSTMVEGKDKNWQFMVFNKPEPQYFRLDRTLSYRGQFTRDKMAALYPGLEGVAKIEFDSKREGGCLKDYYYESKQSEWYKKFGCIASCYYRYGNLLIVGTDSGQLRLYTVEPTIPGSKDILTKSYPFGSIDANNLVSLYFPHFCSESVMNLYLTILNWKTELLYVCRIDIPSEWDTEAEFLARIVPSSWP